MKIHIFALRWKDEIRRSSLPSFSSVLSCEDLLISKSILVDTCQHPKQCIGNTVENMLILMFRCGGLIKLAAYHALIKNYRTLHRWGFYSRPNPCTPPPLPTLSSHFPLPSPSRRSAPRGIMQDCCVTTFVW